jgi:ABC-type Fe3+ transport system substrate-binding protein
VLARGVAIVHGTALEDAARRFVDHVGSVDVATEAKLLTRWEPAHGEVDASRIPIGFEIDTPWTPYPFATDTLVSELGGWVSRWEVQVRAR